MSRAEIIGVAGIVVTIIMGIIGIPAIGQSISGFLPHAPSIGQWVFAVVYLAGAIYILIMYLKMAKERHDHAALKSHMAEIRQKTKTIVDKAVQRKQEREEPWSEIEPAARTALKKLQVLLSSTYTCQLDSILEYFGDTEWQRQQKEVLRDINEMVRPHWDNASFLLPFMSTVLKKIQPIIQAINGALEDRDTHDYKGDLRYLREAGRAYNTVYNYVETNLGTWIYVKNEVERVARV